MPDDDKWYERRQREREDGGYDEPARKMDCPTCGGSGGGDPPFRCPQCRGSGTVSTT